jgi:hydroxyethylthiazole kinase-like uncharacterized protein yjeF
VSKSETALYCCDQIRSCEQQSSHVSQLNETDLMSQAGTEAFFFVLNTYPQVRTIAVFCGAGNNAGDGYVFARLAHEHGLSVIVYQCKAIENLPHAAHNAGLAALAAGVECHAGDEVLEGDVELIIDALLGIGLQGAVYGSIATAIHQINSSGLPVVSLDIPSGLNADTGQVDNFCVNATHTLTFIGLKAGMYTADGADFCGEIHCRSLQLDSILAHMRPYAWLLNQSPVCLPLSARKKNSHKGDYGHVLVIGGGLGMPGAVSLTAKGALRAGAGAVTIATRPEHVNAIVPLIPEAMISGVSKAADLSPLLAQATFCVIGPGLGENDWAKDLFLAAITSQLPMVIDASALRLLAIQPQLDDNWVLTPHPGEAASLLDCSTEEIQRNRYEAAAAIQQQYGGVVILKGAGSIIQTVEKNTFVCPRGNPGMASAGMGDVLSGIIAGLCARGLSLSDSATLGVWVHAVAGDLLAQKMGEAGLLASDLLNMVPNILNCIEI